MEIFAFIFWSIVTILLLWLIWKILKWTFTGLVSAFALAFWAWTIVVYGTSEAWHKGKGE